MTEREFINKWTSKLASDGIKNFPADFFIPDHYKEVRIPGKPLLIGEELFGTFEILAADGLSVLHAEDYQQAKFIIYANRNTPSIIHLPESDEILKNTVAEYEAYLDKIIKDIETDYKKTFPDTKDSNPSQAVTEIFKIMNLVRV
jgi:hypothetical protein